MKQSNSRNSAFQLTASQGGWPHLAGWPLSVPYFNSQPHKEADKDVIVPSRPIWYFNSQPHKEADSCKLQMLGWQLYFNSQPHKEADITHILRRNAHTYFNSQPHKEADNKTREDCVAWDVFQLTASQGGWPIRTLMERRFTHFNSQPHKEADHQFTGMRRRIYISTHSLTRRLTQSYIVNMDEVSISTHSLTRRLTYRF